MAELTKTWSASKKDARTKQSTTHQKLKQVAERVTVRGGSLQLRSVAKAKEPVSFIA